MDTTSIIVLVTLILLNLVGESLYHLTYKKYGLNWKTDKHFIFMSCWFIFFGVAYIPFWIGSKFKK